MIRDTVAVGVSRLSSDLMLEKCSPNDNVLSSALAFDVAVLDTLDDISLSKTIIVLAQYLVSLKYKENEIKIEKMEIEKELHRRAIVEIKQRTWKTNTPFKEKLSSIIDEDTELQEVAQKGDVLDAQLTLLDGMYSSFVEYMNAYKREQGRRSGEAIFTRGANR